MNDLAKKVWEALKAQCAATPDKSKVLSLVMVKEHDVKAAIKRISNE